MSNYYVASYNHCRWKSELSKVPQIFSSGVILASALVFAMISPCDVIASPLAYAPVNPQFGGSALNGSVLLNEANAINKFTAPQAPAQDPAQVQASQFLANLEGRLLSEVAAQVTDAIFGANPQEHGTVTFGTESVTFNRGLSDIGITITNMVTGQQTSISVPLVSTK